MTSDRQYTGGVALRDAILSRQESGVGVTYVIDGWHGRECWPRYPAWELWSAVVEACRGEAGPGATVAMVSAETCDGDAFVSWAAFAEAGCGLYARSVEVPGGDGYVYVDAAVDLDAGRPTPAMWTEVLHHAWGVEVFSGLSAEDRAALIVAGRVEHADEKVLGERCTVAWLSAERTGETLRLRLPARIVGRVEALLNEVSDEP